MGKVEQVGDARKIKLDRERLDFEKMKFFTELSKPNTSVGLPSNQSLVRVIMAVSVGAGLLFFLGLGGVMKNTKLVAIMVGIMAALKLLRFW